jgi:uncharacterized protein (TIGR00297 family)
VAATILGALTLAAGWGWGLLLIGFFVASTALSRVGAERKARLTAAVVEKGGERDARQVLANGGTYGVAALCALLSPSTVLAAAGAGALAAATADTWATEVGTLAGGAPRSVTSWRVVPPGTSGAVTLAGTVAAVAGALFIGAFARLLGFPDDAAWAGVVGGVVGSAADSLLGATVQARRHCPRCDQFTERLVHDCGAPTRHAGGLAWLDNDGVNLLCTAAGAGAAVLWLAG